MSLKGELILGLSFTISVISHFVEAKSTTKCYIYPMELEGTQNPYIIFEAAVLFHNEARLRRTRVLIDSGLAGIAWQHALDSLKNGNRETYESLVGEVKVDPYEYSGVIGIRFSIELSGDVILPSLEAPVMHDDDRVCLHHEYTPHKDMLETLVLNMHATNEVAKWFERCVDHSDLPDGQVTHLRSLMSQSKNYLIPRELPPTTS